VGDRARWGWARYRAGAGAFAVAGVACGDGAWSVCGLAVGDSAGDFAELDDVPHRGEPWAAWGVRFHRAFGLSRAVRGGERARAAAVGARLGRWGATLCELVFSGDLSARAAAARRVPERLGRPGRVRGGRVVRLAARAASRDRCALRGFAL